jgi:hypothetical protein
VIAFCDETDTAIKSSEFARSELLYERYATVLFLKSRRLLNLSRKLCLIHGDRQLSGAGNQIKEINALTLQICVPLLMARYAVFFDHFSKALLIAVLFNPIALQPASVA